MANIHKESQVVRSTYGGISTALGGESNDRITSSWLDMANYDLVVAKCVASDLASDSVITLAIWQATDTSGGGSKTVSGASDTFTSTNTTDTDILTCQVRGQELDVASGFRYVAGRVSTDDASGTEVVGLVMEQMRGRYKQATLPS